MCGVFAAVVRDSAGGLPWRVLPDAPISQSRTGWEHDVAIVPTTNAATAQRRKLTDQVRNSLAIEIIKVGSGCQVEETVGFVRACLNFQQLSV